jgi:hypothetical protein
MTTLHEDITRTMLSILGAQLSRQAVNTTTLATYAMREYDGASLEPHIEYASREHFKHIARGLVARTLDADAEESAAYQGELFSGQLQTHYPKARQRGEEPVYIPREAMTDDDVRFNCDKLRKSGQARFDHADALEAWNERRTPTGEVA